MQNNKMLNIENNNAHLHLIIWGTTEPSYITCTRDQFCLKINLNIAVTLI